MAGFLKFYYIFLLVSERYEVQNCLQQLSPTSISHHSAVSLHQQHFFSLSPFLSIHLSREYTGKDNARLSCVNKLKELNDAEVSSLELGLYTSKANLQQLLRPFPRVR